MSSFDPEEGGPGDVPPGPDEDPIPGENPPGPTVPERAPRAPESFGDTLPAPDEPLTPSADEPVSPHPEEPPPPRADEPFASTATSLHCATGG